MDGVYTNYMDFDEIERVRSSYGENYERLRKVKARYDPDNLFRMNQNIPPAKLAARKSSLGPRTHGPAELRIT